MSRVPPVLSGNGPSVAPDGPLCLQCGQSYAGADSNAFIMGGANRVDPVTGDSIACTDDLKAYFCMGLHPVGDSEVDVGVDLVQDLIGGEFQLNYCSLQCMKQWWMNIFDEMISQQESQKK